MCALFHVLTSILQRMHPLDRCYDYVNKTFYDLIMRIEKEANRKVLSTLFPCAGLNCFFPRRFQFTHFFFVVSSLEDAFAKEVDAR